MSKLDELSRRFGGFAEQSLAPLAPAGEPVRRAELPARLQGLVRSKDAAEISVDRISPDPNQPREVFDEEAIDRLATSLKARGVLQPLRVRWDEEQSCYVLIAGERRWRAAVKAGLARVPCVIHEGVVEATELLALQLIENVLREDLPPCALAKGYRRLMEARGWSAADLAQEIHVPHSTVLRTLELLQLPPRIQDLVERGELAPSAACEIGRLDQPEDQIAVAERAVVAGLTRAEVVAEVRSHRAGGRGKSVGRRGNRKITRRVYKHDGVKVMVERSRGLDDAAEIAALEAALTEVRSRTAGRAHDAA
jgi:ParB family chromosome partitioning protein